MPHDTDHVRVPLAQLIELQPALRQQEPTLVGEVTAWFEELRAPVLRYLASVGLVPQDREEIAQEVFLALFDHLKQGRPRTNLRGWIFRVAHNLALKRRSRGVRLVAWDEDIASGRRATEPDPEQRFSDLQRRRRLLAVVRSLAPKERSCLMLRAEGLRYREIAEALGMSLGAVAIALERALSKLNAVGGR